MAAVTSNKILQGAIRETRGGTDAAPAVGTAAVAVPPHGATASKGF